MRNCSERDCLSINILLVKAREVVFVCTKKNSELVLNPKGSVVFPYFGFSTLKFWCTLIFCLVVSSIVNCVGNPSSSRVSPRFLSPSTWFGLKCWESLLSVKILDLSHVVEV